MQLQGSVKTLLQLIKQRQQADIVALVPPEEGKSNYATSVTVSLETADRHLFIGWRETRPDPELAGIAPLIGALQLVVSRTEQHAQLHQLLVETTRLEWELADHKISERTAGVIASGEAELLRVGQHVARVLASITQVDALSERLRHLETELADRKKITAAKAILYKHEGLTEQQAYLRLQQLSRRTRRTIADVASDILTGRVEAGRRIA